MTDKPTANLRPAMYAHRVHELQSIARACGYALALHGSMQRDLDAIAVPWTKLAVDARTLVERICEGMGLLVADGSPGDKPHGRQVWSLLLGDVGFVDLSVMPRRSEIGFGFGRPEKPCDDCVDGWCTMNCSRPMQATNQRDGNG